jgi:serine phosphatase RsbU (regulator of sigma subunit)
MRLRTKLILSFLLLSVLPLSLVTLYSYRSSVRAFRQAVEQQAWATAADMGQRMALVTTELGRRVERLWEPPAAAPAAHAVAAGPAATDEASAADAVWQERTAAMLGEAAALLERVEVVSSPSESAGGGERRVFLIRPDGALPVPSGVPLPPPAPPRPAPAPAPAAPLPPPPPKAAVAAEGEKAVVTLQDLLDRARQEIAKASDGAEGNRAELAQLMDVVGRQVVTGLELGRQGAIVGMRLGAAELARQAERQRHAAERHKMMITKGELDVDVEREGKVVGKVNARVNLGRVLGSVLALTRTDEGEVPFAVDPDGRLYTARDDHRRRLEALDVAGSGGAGTHEGVTTQGDWVIVTRRDQSGVVFGLARPLGDPLREIRRASVRNLALGLGVIGLALVGMIPLSGGMTRNLSRLTDGAHRLARGDFSVRVPVRSGDEFGQLAQSFNQMAAGLESHQKLVVEQERLHRELELCRRIQTEMLPRTPLRLDLAEVKGISIPAREVGGDFFNYFVLPEGDLALVVGDVSGKGVSAALLMANIQATLRARMPLERDLARLVDTIDREVDASTPGGVYVTLFVGILDHERKVLRFINAGHNPQFVLRAGGGLDRMPSAGLPVGLFAGHGYTEREMALGEADLLFFYTDGMVETENESGEMFGAERLEALLGEATRDNVDEILDRIEQAVRRFRGSADLFDDATMMALRLGHPAPRA